MPDKLGLDLLVHCAEEMNHLARFLPALYRKAHGPLTSAREARVAR